MKRFTDSAAISNKESKAPEELRNEIDSNEYAISTFGENTEDWREAQLNLEEKKGELSKQIKLSFGFGELGAILSNFEEDKMRKASQELIRREIVGCQLPTIQEGVGGWAVGAISDRRFREI